MKLHCFFNYIREIYCFKLNARKSGYVYIYEYSQKRYGYLKDRLLILYMVALTNKDGYAKDADIKRGFYTLGQVLDYVTANYSKNIEKG